MKAWNQITHYAGFDWAKDHHDVIILDSSGKIVADFRFEHTAGGWEQFREKLAAYAGVAVAIVKFGTVIEHAAGDRLLHLSCASANISPRLIDNAKFPAATKPITWMPGAWAARYGVDGANWKQLAPQEPLLKELRLLCRDEVALIRDRTALITQLRQTLYDYYPAALEAFDDWTMPAAWAFILAFPTPEALVKGGKRKWGKIPARPQTRAV